MFVGVYEKLFHVQVVDIIRNPVQPQDYIHNIQLIINSLITNNLSSYIHVSAEEIQKGNLPAIDQLLDIFLEICDMTETCIYIKEFFILQPNIK